MRIIGVNIQTFGVETLRYDKKFSDRNFWQGLEQGLETKPPNILANIAWVLLRNMKSYSEPNNTYFCSVAESRDESLSKR